MVQILLPIAVLLSVVAAGGASLFVLAYGRLYLTAITSQVRIGPLDLIRMHFLKLSPAQIVHAMIQARQASLSLDGVNGITTKRLEAHALSNGNVPRVIAAIISAQKANMDLDFDRAAAIDLAGRDVLDAVKTSVDPKVINCPDPARSGKSTLSAISRDGIELRVRARVTVRTNLEQLIGGATEDTIIARVGESIISSIGSADTHKAVLENPDMITRNVMSRGLDAQTAYEIVSIDIADVDVGENIGARLQADQAEADTRVARAAAEKKRAEAIAQEQLMKAQVAENRALVVLAEAEVPHALAETFRSGHIIGDQKDTSL
jgi:uncharacterized protein YqfA (UPF0365 family)